MYSVIQKQKAYCKAGDFIYKNKDTIYPILSFAASCDPVLNKLSGRLIKLREEEESKDFFVSFLIPIHDVVTDFELPDLIVEYLDTKLLSVNKTDEFFTLLSIMYFEMLAVEFSLVFLKNHASEYYREEYCKLQPLFLDYIVDRMTDFFCNNLEGLENSTSPFYLCFYPNDPTRFNVITQEEDNNLLSGTKPMVPMDKRLKSLCAIELSCDTHVKTRH